MQATPLAPGDVLLVKTHHFASRLIRFGQRGYPPADRVWNHVAIVVSETKIVEALTKGVVVSAIDKYPQKDVRAIVVKAKNWNGPRAPETYEPVMRANAAAFAHLRIGEGYGWATIAAIAVKVLTKGRVDFGISGTSICSGLVAQGLERLGYDWNPWDPAELTPAYLAKALG